MCNNKDVEVSNEELERNELLIWIPSLIREKLNILNIEQLRILHYVLGYNCGEMPAELLTEELEGYDYDEDVANEISNILKRDNFLIMQKPY